MSVSKEHPAIGGRTSPIGGEDFLGLAGDPDQDRVVQEKGRRPEQIYGVAEGRRRERAKKQGGAGKPPTSQAWESYETHIFVKDIDVAKLDRGGGGGYQLGKCQCSSPKSAITSANREKRQRAMITSS